MTKTSSKRFEELGPFMYLVQKRLAKKERAGFDLMQAIIDDVPIKPPVILAPKKYGDVQIIVGGLIGDGWLYIWFQCHNKNFSEMVCYDLTSNNGNVKRLSDGFNNCPSPYEGKSGSLIIASHWYSGLRRGIFIYRGKKIAEIEYQEKSNRHVLTEPLNPRPIPESLSRTRENLGKVFSEKEVGEILERHAASTTGAGDGWHCFPNKKGCLRVKHPQGECGIYLRNGSLYLVY